MSSEPPSSSVDLVRCPGCGRRVIGSIRTCTFCKMELRLTSGPPAAKGDNRTKTERCALCGLAYDALSHDACPHCTERFGKRERAALDAHHRGRKATQGLVWVVAAAALTAMGLVAHWGASEVAPTLGARRAMWTWGVAGGLLMGALAGWRLRERSSTIESLVAVSALSIVTAVWLKAALVWANGFNLGGQAHELPCEVLGQREGYAMLSCAVAGEPVGGEVEDLRAEGDQERHVVVKGRRGRLGYWVVASGTLRSVVDAVEDAE